VTAALIFGMNNPKGREALSPRGRGAGGRLFEIARLHGGFSEEEYEREFSRRNVLDRRRWDQKRARGGASRLRWLARRVGKVVVLGREAWAALGLPSKAPFFSQVEEGGATWLLLPHPSGRNLLLNDERARETMGSLLRKVVS
jgi:hypothetical protein